MLDAFIIDMLVFFISALHGLLFILYIWQIITVMFKLFDGKYSLKRDFLVDLIPFSPVVIKFLKIGK